MTAVLITGASRGIGACAARRFAAAGFDLLLLARSGPELEALAAELRGSGRRVETAIVDLADAANLAAKVMELCGRGLTPGVLINNAGVAYTGSLAEMSLDRWQWLLQINLTSVFQVSQAVLPQMLKAGGGTIINVNSHAARNAFPDWGAYCVSKAGLASFSRCLAEEERCHAIRVCTLTIGAVNTPIWDTETVHATFDRHAMLDPEQVADALLFLAQQPSGQVAEDLTLMPAAGAF